MPDVQWYYARNEKQFGPVSAGELKQLANAGDLAPDDLLWREGMEAWTTAINLRGLFEEGAAVVAKDPIAVNPASLMPTPPRAAGVSVHAVARFTQVTLWAVCVLVVLVGAALFIRAFLAAESPAEEAAAGAIYSTFFIGAYVLARAGDTLSRLLIAASRRRR
jgi:hypothetical protein